MLMSDILALVHRINEETDYAAWFEYSGHVQSIDVKIALGKEEPHFQEKIAQSKTIYLNNKFMDAEEELTKLRDNLEMFLDTYKEVEHVPVKKETITRNVYEVKAL